MKKFILLFVSILSFSLLLVNNKAYAQELPREYPTYLVLFNYNTYSLEQENTNTFEYIVYYYIFSRFYDTDTLGVNDYFLINDIGLNFRKGIDRRTNSYEIELLERDEDTTYLELRVTVLKTLVTEYSNHPNGGIAWLFFNDTKLYVLFQSNQVSLDYLSGYNDGRDDGYVIGYDEGYLDGRDDGYELGQNDGYNYGFELGRDVGYGEGLKAAQPEVYERGKQDGYNEAAKEFKENFGLKVDVWLVPAIIIVFAIGIFVTYRKGRE